MNEQEFIRELSDEELMYATPEDWYLYNEAIKGLPTREGFKGNFLDKDNIEIPYGSGPHLLPVFRETLKLVKPRAILEIGFNLGHGSAMFLKLNSLIKIDSLDISEKWETLYASLFLQIKHRNNFFFYKRQSFFPYPSYGEYDLVFIDGGHDEENVTKDIQLAKDLDIEYLLFDDCYPRFGPGVMPAISKYPDLKLVKDFNNLRLYTWAKD